MHSSEIVDDVLVVHVNETRATLAHSKEFKEYTQRLPDGDVKNILIDLSKCEYIDSTYMGAVVELYKKTEKAGGIMKIVCHDKVAYLICVVNRLNTFIEVFEKVDEAVKSFKK